MFGGTEAAHWLAFRLVYPDPYERSLALQSSGHGDLTWLPSLGAAGLSLLLSGLVLGSLIPARRGLRPVAPARFACLPPLTFALQEHLESLLHSSSLLGVVCEPTFMLGMLLQLPFAIAAYYVARALLGAAEQVSLLMRGRPPLLAAVVGSSPCTASQSRLVPGRLALALLRDRGPPVAAFV
jgi:hypothetical protein